jgi:hypothetical protein
MGSAVRPAARHEVARLLRAARGVGVLGAEQPLGVTVRRLVFATLSCDQVVALEQVSNQVLHQIGAVGGPGR